MRGKVFSVRRVTLPTLRPLQQRPGQFMRRVKIFHNELPVGQQPRFVVRAGVNTHGITAALGEETTTTLPLARPSAKLTIWLGLTRVMDGVPCA